jgi:hypothetical protein
MADPFSTFLNTTSGHVSFGHVQPGEAAGVPGPYAQHTELPDEAWQILEVLASTRSLEVSALREPTGLSTMRLAPLLSMLADLGLVLLSQDKDDDIADITAAGAAALYNRQGGAS